VLPISKSLKHLPPNLINRHYKIFPHLYLPKSDWSIYIDGNIRILGDFSDLIEQVKCKGAAMACPRHPWRYNIFDEAEACLRINKFSEKDKRLIDQQLADYRAAGMPDNLPLSGNYVIIRAHRDYRVQEAMQLWWDHLQRYTQRDQISLPYVIWKKEVPFCLLSWEVPLHNRHFTIISHRRPGLLGVFNYLKARRFDGRFWRLSALAAGRISKASYSISKRFRK